MADFQNSDGSFFGRAAGLPVSTYKITTGTTITMKWNERDLYIITTAPIAAATVKLPLKARNGEFVRIASEYTISALTVQDGFGNAITGLPVEPLTPGAAITLRWVDSLQYGNAAWVPWEVDLGLTVIPWAFVTNTQTSAATPSAANLTGGAVGTVIAFTGTMSGDSTITLPTVALMVAALQPASVGQSFKLRFINESSANHTWTVTTATGWTLNGTMTVAQNTWRDFIVTLTSLTAATLQNVGTGTFS